MSRFGGLDARRAAQAAPKAAEPTEAEAVAPQAAKRSVVAKAREGKKPIIGYFSPELSRELRTLSIAKNTTMQALMGEAFDLLFTAHGKNRFGER